MKKTISITVILSLLTALFIGCAEKKEEYSKYSYNIFGNFDTVITIVAYTKTEEEFNKLIEYSKNRFSELNNMFDIYNDYAGISNIKTINDKAGITPVSVSTEIIELLEFSKQWYMNTNGLVNIALGSVLEVWHDVREDASLGNIYLPDIEVLKEKNKYTNINNVIIDKENSTVFLKDEQMKLDVGSVAKGYATEIVAAELANDYDSFAISAGGNVRTHGTPKDGREYWNVGVQNPEIDENFQMVQGNIDLVYINDSKSVVCSGGYQRFFVFEGKRYHHLINPITLFPEEYYQGVTIIAQDSGIADVLSTAIFMLNKAEAINLIEKIEGVECLLVLDNGDIVKSSRMDSYLASAIEGEKNTSSKQED